MTHQEMLARYTVIRDKAEMVRRTMVRRARVTCNQSGIDANSIGTAGHNAMIDFRAGRPWSGVNYPLLRRALWQMDRSFGPGRVASVAWSRLYSEWRTGGFQ